MYIGYLQNSLQLPLMNCDNQGSYLTNEGAIIIIKFDRIINFINHLIKQKYNTNKNIRLALEKGIDISASVLNDHSYQDITVFTDNPDLHLSEWDIAIGFSKPQSENVIVFYSRKIKCGFFASIDYLSNFGTPKDLEDVKKNHLILDGRNRSYADKNYCEFIDDCQNTRFIENSNIAILDTVVHGSGLCLAPLSIPRNNLVYLEHLSCNAEATLYLYVHKPFTCISRYRQAMDNYRKALSLI